METIYDIIIVGGGPAGLTAGIYASRARLKTLLIENYSIPSQAVITNDIENYPGFPDGVNGFELIERMKKQAENFGLQFSAGDVKRIDRSMNLWQVEARGNTSGNNKYNCQSIIIATGSRHKELGVAGEARFRGQGVSYCATCDGAFFRDKDIIVVGGGDAAVEEALFLTRFGRKVTLIHRRDRLRATQILQERALVDEKIEFILDSQIIEILGDKNVEAVKVKNIRTNEESRILCDGVFIFIGLIPNTDFLKGVLELDKSGYVITDNDMKTSTEGIFTAGDCRKTQLRQIITACSDGAMAAFSAQQYIEGLKGSV